MAAAILAAAAGCAPAATSPAAEYRLPWSADNGKQAVLQGIFRADPVSGDCRSGCLTHSGDGQQFGWDFALPEGAPVLASRAGTVGLAAGSWSPDHCGGLAPVEDPPPGYLVDAAMGNQANLVRVDHGDGTSALYLHLQEVSPGILAKARDHGPVAQGEVLGLSGKTGLTGCVPHLHFQVETTVPADWFTDSVPARFADRDVVRQNPDGIPAEGGSYVSDNVMLPGNP